MADVPSLQDSSAHDGLSELCGAIVIHLACRVRTAKSGSLELATRVVLDHHLVTDLVGVIFAVFVLPLVILKDKVLLSFLDALPVCDKRDV